jgi:hypothetical protein
MRCFPVQVRGSSPILLSKYKRKFYFKLDHDLLLNPFAVQLNNTNTLCGHNVEF